MKYICKKATCTGCHACYSVCPKACISMQEDEYGYIYPTIDSKLCIDCGRCKKVCPALNTPVLKEPDNTYAAINKNKCDYAEATSGGVATLFSRKIISEGGVVYGAAVCEELKVKHIRATDMNDVERLKGSKYVQSIIGDCYRSAKIDLEAGKQVLFIGTPCQIVGLYAFLGNKYDLLYTCDIVCHGVPPYRYLREHLEAVGVFENADKISFRNKYGFYLSVNNNGEQVYDKKNFYDIYYLGFLKSLYYRHSCYTCSFAARTRIADVTLGDFWGFNSKEQPFPANADKGLSLVLVNTEKGKKLFDICKHELIYQQRDTNEAVAGNKQLRNPSIKHKNYESFKKNYLKYGFEKSAKKALRKERIVYAIIDKVSK